MAYSTLTEYCIHELGYGDSSASRRVRAARVINKIPEVYDLLKKNKLTFSAVVQVYSVLTPENKDALLPRLMRKSRSEIERIMADYVPPRKIFDQAKPTLVKKLVAVDRGPALEMGEKTRHSDGSKDPTDKISTPEVKVVLERMFEVRFAADEELMELVRWLKSHLSHKYPNGASFLDIFKFAMSYVKEREDRSIQKKARNASAKTDTRYIPKATKQKVWKRDKGRCSFVGSNGKQRDSDYNLQFDHYPIPYARGGPSSVNNLRLLCAKHNRFTAEKVYGEQAIKKHYIKEARAEYQPPKRLLIERFDGTPRRVLSRCVGIGRECPHGTSSFPEIGYNRHYLPVVGGVGLEWTDLLRGIKVPQVNWRVWAGSEMDVCEEHTETRSRRLFGIPVQCDIQGPIDRAVGRCWIRRDRWSPTPLETRRQHSTHPTLDVDNIGIAIQSLDFSRHRRGMWRDSDGTTTVHTGCDVVQDAKINRIIRIAAAEIQRYSGIR